MHEAVPLFYFDEMTPAVLNSPSVMCQTENWIHRCVL